MQHILAIEKMDEMNFDKSTKEGVLQQLNYLSKRYEELLMHFDEIEHPIKPPTVQKPSWLVLFKIKCKERF